MCAYFLDYNIVDSEGFFRGQSRLPNFKIWKGGGSFSIPKINLQIFGLTSQKSFGKFPKIQPFGEYILKENFENNVHPMVGLCM